MRKILLILSAFMILTGTSCSNKEPDQADAKPRLFEDEKMVTIARLQDERDVDSLIPFMKAKKEEYRERAARAFGSVRNPKALPYLFLMLQSDKESRPRRTAAWAIGQIGDPNAVGDLIKVFSMEMEASVQAEILEAIGKCANPEALEFLRNYETSNTVAQTGHAAGIYRSLFTMGVDSVLIQRAFEYLMDNQEERTDFYAVKYLERTKSVYDLPTVVKLIELVLVTGNSDIRTALIQTLANSSMNQLQAGEMIKASTAIPERTAMVRLLVHQQNPAFDQSELLHQVADTWETEDGINYRLIAYKHAIERGNTAIFNPDLKYPPIIGMPEDELIALSHGMMMARYNDNIASYLKSLFNKTGDFNKAAIINALGISRRNYAWIRDIAGSGDMPALARYYAYNTLYNMDLSDCKCEYENSEYFNMINEALRSGDVLLQMRAAEAIESDKFNNPYSPQDIAPLEMLLDSAIAEMTLPKETETWYELQKARAKLRGETFHFTNPEHGHPVNWEEVSRIPETQKVKIKTSKGDIIIECYVNDAPGSVWNFLNLVDDGFYNGKIFHRVDRNFVIQGGCPRGDGMGALDWSQRSELSPNKTFIAGAVGLASVGPDTEGVQFFITHIPTPHLDGRYTVFAYVTSGMDVVQKIKPGDKIVEVVRD